MMGGLLMPANVESMFYVGETPWHREGKKLLQPPGSSEEAIKLAGLDWTVEKRELLVPDYEKNKGHILKKIEGYYAIQRSDTRDIFTVVKEDYTVLQNKDAFKFFDPLLKEEYVAFETAGSIGKGEIVWVMAKNMSNSKFEVVKDDEVYQYLLLFNSHDGTFSVTIKFTPIRVVCQNTLNYALSRGDEIKIKHLPYLHKKLDDAGVEMKNRIERVYGLIKEEFIEMGKRQLKAKEVHDYFKKIYPVVISDGDEIELDDIQLSNKHEKLKKNIVINKKLNDVFENESEIRYAKGTLWLAYNAITQYIDHPSNYNYGDNKFLKRIWFGEGENIKKKALIEARKLLVSA